MTLKSNLTLAIAACAALLAPTYARASACGATVTLPSTCTGVLDSESGTPGSIAVEEFTLASTSDVTLFTTSYGGGTNLDGSTTSAGGFQPNLAIFDTTGLAVAFQTGMASPIGNTDPATGLNLDAYVTDMAAGTYYAILSDINNQLSASFSGFGNTAPSDFYTLFSGPGGTSFTDVQGNTRDGNYALNLEATSLTSAAPEPATLWLVIPAVLGVALLRRRRSLII
ncbi:MAG: DVUA0089 family protein [Bryobacteraceae bacterium]